MRTVTIAALGLAASLTAGACSSMDTYVESDSALGRVVVYRNGIAYYERRAQVTGNTITLEVPHDKVDDFLKSLTVADAKTRKTLPISFPTRGAGHSNTVDMTIQLPGNGPHDVVITYITEAPAWKPTYRVVVDDQNKVKVQGWAIVDNTSGEDWKKVRVGVGSSSALSFRYDLRSVRTVHRETLHDQERFAKAPPTGGSTYGGEGRKDKGAAGKSGAQRRLEVTLNDAQIPRAAGHPDIVEGELDADKPAARSTRTRNEQAEQQVKQLAQQLRHRPGVFTIEGYGDPNDRDAKARALDRANMLRNQLIKSGVEPARLKVVAKGVVPGRTGGVRLVEHRLAETGAGDGGSQPVGESHFESKTPLSVDRGTSAMVAILQKATEGEVVYLYAADTERGNDKFAFKSVRFVNPTDSTLETGPVTFYGDNRFIGEGMTDPIPPGATAIVPFALDRQVVVERQHESGDEIARLISLVRGVLTSEVQHTRTTKLKLTNRLTKPATVYVRHYVRKGWELAKSPKVYERQGEAHLFEVTLAKGETKSLEIVEATPLRRTLDLRSDVGIELVKVYLRTHETDRRFEEPIQKLLKLHTEMANNRQSIASLRERIGEFRARADELHTQIISLKEVKTGGSLMRHLQKKLQEMSERIQKATIQVVDHQEKLMLARIRFQDAVSELSLPDALADKGGK